MTDMPSDTVSIRFFARLREELDTEELTMAAAPGLTAGVVLEQLASRGGAWAQLEGDRPVMIAVNQTMANANTAVKAGDELAFFPPVTGG